MYMLCTEELFSQHAELLLVKALASQAGELPAEDLGQLAPRGPRWVPKKCQVLLRKIGFEIKNDSL